MNRFLLLLALLGALGTPVLASPVLHAHPASAVAPVIDGRVTDEIVWQLKGLGAELTLGGNGQVPTQRTRCGVLYDAQNLYVGFVCDEDQPAKIQAQRGPRDADCQGQDVVEFFLSAGGEDSPWYRFTINAVGVLGEAMNWERGYNTGAVAAAARTATGWSAELRLPLGDLRPDLAVQNTWRVNFVRREKPHGELSAWAPWSDELVAVARFGELQDVLADWPAVVRAGLDRRAQAIQSQAQALVHKANAYTGFPLAHTVLAGASDCLRESATLARIARQAEATPEELALAPALATRLEQRLLRLNVLGSRLELLRQAAGADFALCQVLGESGNLAQPPRLEPVRRLDLAVAAGSQQTVSLLVVPLRSTLRQLTVTVEANGAPTLTAACAPEEGVEAADVPLTGIQGYRLQLEAPADMQPGLYTATVVIATERGGAVRVPLSVRISKP